MKPIAQLSLTSELSGEIKLTWIYTPCESGCLAMQRDTKMTSLRCQKEEEKRVFFAFFRFDKFMKRNIYILGADKISGPLL